MRVSTSMIYNQGVSTINTKTAQLLHTQQQVASGKRILNPADDPVAAARALEVSQSIDVNSQQATNLKNADSALSLEDSQLSSVNDLLTRVKQLLVQAGNTSLSTSDRQAISTELRSNYSQLMGLANSADGTGNYLFAGYMGNTIPFGGSVDVLNQSANTEVSYFGDSGQRSLQVSATRQLATSDAGDSVFRRITNGNGYFTTDYATSNAGSGIINAGSVTNPAAWNNSTAKNVSVVFSVDSSVVPPKTYYDLVDTTVGSPTSGTSLLTGNSYGLPLTSSSAPTIATSGTPLASPLSQLRVYTDGQPITLSGVTTSGVGSTFDLGSTLTITGSPAQGDSFSLAPSTTQSVFKTLATAINALETAQTGTTSGMAAYSNEIGFALTNIDQANNHILTVRAAVGSRLNEVDSLTSVNGSLDTQYQQNLSNLQDLDYAKAISDLMQQQTNLQAAQQTFSTVSKLSLFSYL